MFNLDDLGTIGEEPMVIEAYANVTAPPDVSNQARLSRDWLILLMARERAAEAAETP